MTWDNNKNTFDSRPSVPSDEKLTASEWNNHVSDQKGRVRFGPLANRPAAADADNGDVFFVTDLANDAGIMTKLVSGSWEIMGLGDSSNKLPQVFADEVTTDEASIATVESITTATAKDERIKIAKETKANGSQVWSFSGASDRIRSSPTVVDGVVYVGSNDSSLYAVDASNGSQVWSFSGASGRIRSSPTVVDGTVYVGSDDNSLYAVDASNGSQVWSFSGASGDILSSPTVVDGTVYVGSKDSSLYAVDASDGSQIWSFSGPSARIFSSPTVVDGTVYVGSNDNSLYAVDAVKRFARLYVADQYGWVPLHKGPNEPARISASTLTGDNEDSGEGV